jgi:hypothetical protein
MHITVPDAAPSCCQPIELADQRVGIFARAHVVDEEAVVIVDLKAVGHRDQPPAATLTGIGWSS